MNGLFPPSLDGDVIRAMKDAGFRSLNLSLGTASSAQQKRFNRPDVRESFDRAIFHAEQCGLGAVGYVIAGAPGQDASASVSDLLYLAGKRVLAGVSIYYPSPGSVDYQKCKDARMLPEKLSLMRSTALPISDTTTRVDSVTLVRLGRILNYIKSLLDNEEGLSECMAPRKPEMGALPNRQELGRNLLNRFMCDGIIRGVTPDGEVFEHLCSRSLCTKFISGLRKIAIKGA